MASTAGELKLLTVNVVLYSNDEISTTFLFEVTLVLQEISREYTQRKVDV